MKNKIIISAAFSCASLAFFGCGEDVTKMIIQADNLESVASIKDLPECTRENRGTMEFVSDSAKIYYCADSSWQQLNGENGVDGIDGKDGAQGKDGKNGTNGVDGVDGINGKTCFAEDLDDKSGYKIICNGDSIGVVLKGAKGEQGIQGDQGEKGEDGKSGKNGADGTNCSVEDNGEGTVTVTCGEKSIDFIKGVCNLQAYDPANKFCYDNIVYNLCGGKTYNPNQKFCHENELYDYCDGKVYNPTELQCKSNKFVFTDTRGSGREYKVTLIGSQTWMAENLDYNVEESYCYYSNKWNDSLANCAKYGRLYTWDAAKTACPDGWHLPDNAEWDALLNFVLEDNNLGTTNKAGTYLKSESGWSSYGTTPAGNDKYGFNALPGGLRVYDLDSFGGIGGNAYFWSSSGTDDFAKYYQLEYKNESFERYDYSSSKSHARSIRCLKNSN